MKTLNTDAPATLPVSGSFSLLIICESSLTEEEGAPTKETIF